jgi:ADP-heptose:LPS heptosyltransferase
VALSRLLVLRALGLGDFLTGVPALRALRRAFPDHELVLAAPAVLQPLVTLADVADRLLDTRDLDALRWSSEPPDLAVNLHGRGPQSHALLQSLRPRRLLGFACTGHPGPGWDDDEHEVRRWCRLVSDSLSVAADPLDLRLRVPSAPAPAPRAVVVHPGAAYQSRRWPADRFASVAAALSAAGHDVVVTGGPGEISLAQAVASRAELPAEAVLAGRTDLLQLAAQVASAQLVICGDTGMAHLATAFRTPSVLLFGPMPPSRWGPVGDGPHTVLWHGSGVGDPWGDDVDPALLRISVDEVVDQAMKMVASASSLR